MHITHLVYGDFIALYFKRVPPESHTTPLFQAPWSLLNLEGHPHLKNRKGMSEIILNKPMQWVPIRNGLLKFRIKSKSEIYEFQYFLFPMYLMKPIRYFDS